MKKPVRGWARIFLAYGLVSGAVLVGAIITLASASYLGIPVSQHYPGIATYLLKLVGGIVFVGGLLVFLRYALDDEYKNTKGIESPPKR